MNANENRRLIYEMIKYFAEILNYPFDISSYHIYKDMENQLNIKFANKRISKFIAKNNNYISKNRLCIVLNIKDGEIKRVNKNAIFTQQVVKKMNETFWKSDVLNILDEYEKDAKIRLILKKNKKTAIAYILIFNLPNNSSIEFIVTISKSTSLLHMKNAVREIEQDYRKFKIDTYEFERERRRLDSNFEDT